jgi:branched-chain amino acid transport system substrate-binding protein
VADENPEQQVWIAQPVYPPGFAPPPPPPPPPPPFAPRRSRTPIVIAIVVAALVLCCGGGVAAYFGFRTVSGPGSSASCGVKLLYTGAAGDGGFASLGDVSGMRLALEEYNAKHAKCKVTVIENTHPRTGGAGSSISRALDRNPDVIGVLTPGIGIAQPAFSTTLKQYKLSAISTSGSHLCTEVGNVFCLFPSADLVARASAIYLQQTLKASKVILIDEGNGFYEPFLNSLQKHLGPAYAGTAQTNGRSTRDVAAQVKSSGANAVYYVGATGAGNVLKAIRTAGVAVPFLGSDAVESPLFKTDADTNFVGSIGIWGEFGKASAEFKAKYRERFGQPANVVSAPAYDAASIYLAGIDAGKKTPQELAEFVATYSGSGIAGSYSFARDGSLAPDKATIYAYRATTDGFPDTGSQIPLS